MDKVNLFQLGKRGRNTWSTITVPGYNLHIMMGVLGCVIGVTAVIAIVRLLRVQRTLKENRMMRNYLRRIASDSNSL